MHVAGRTSTSNFTCLRQTTVHIALPTVAIGLNGFPIPLNIAATVCAACFAGIGAQALCFAATIGAIDLGGIGLIST